jgi:hypothetical protein
VAVSCPLPFLVVLLSRITTHSPSPPPTRSAISSATRTARGMHRRSRWPGSARSRLPISVSRQASAAIHDRIADCVAQAQVALAGVRLEAAPPTTNPGRSRGAVYGPPGGPGVGVSGREDHAASAMTGASLGSWQRHPTPADGRRTPPWVSSGGDPRRRGRILDANANAVVDGADQQGQLVQR